MTVKKNKIDLPTPINCSECNETNKLYQCGDCMELFCENHIRLQYEFCEKWDGYDSWCCDKFPTNHKPVGYGGSCECNELI